MAQYNVNHITCSPHYPQSNGLAEKHVQIVKNLSNKAKEEGKDLYQCLMIYHNTPLSNTLQSLMQILKVDQLDQVYLCQTQQDNKNISTVGS